MNKSKVNKIAAKTLKDGIERRKKLRNCPKFGDHLTSYEPVGDTPIIAIDLLSAAEDAYKSLRELGQHGNNISNIRNYIDALEKELDKSKRMRGNRPLTKKINGWSEEELTWREYNAAPPARLNNDGTVDPPQQTEAGKLE